MILPDGKAINISQVSHMRKQGGNRGDCVVRIWMIGNPQPLEIRHNKEEEADAYYDKLALSIGLRGPDNRSVLDVQEEVNKLREKRSKVDDTA